MKTSNKLLLGLFCLIIASFVTFNILLKPEMDKLQAQEAILKTQQKANLISHQKDILISHSQIIKNSLLIDSTKVLLSIDKNTTKDELNTYQTKLKEVNISLNVDKIEFNPMGKIKQLAITVDCNDGYQGWANLDLSGNDKIGFYRIYDKNSNSSFGMSPLEFKVQRSGNGTKTYVSISDNLENKVNPGLINQKYIVCLTIGKNTTLSELKDYQAKLKARNINFMVTKIELDSLKKIKTIEISVNCNDGFKGTIKQTLNNQKLVGFCRNYSKNTLSPFVLLPIPF